MSKERWVNEVNEEVVVDCHTHASGIDAFNFFVPRAPSSQSINELEEKITRAGVSYCIVFPMPFTLYYNPRLALKEGKLQPSGLENFPYEVENKTLLYEVGLSSGRFIPFLAIDPKEKVEKQVEFLRKSRRYFGLKLHTMATQSSVEDLENSPFLEILQERDIPLMVHSGREKNTLPITILNFAKRHPNIRICIAHLAGFDSWVLQQISTIPNLFVDTSPFSVCCNLATKRDPGYLSDQNLEIDYSDPVKVLVSIYGLLKEHIIWGTDEPWTTITDPKTGKIIIKSSYTQERLILEKLAQAGFSEIKYKIANYNIKRFLFG